jgi:hypothetical protein
VKIVKLKNLDKKDIPLHYRNEYSGTAVFKTQTDSRLEKKVAFVLERLATGEKEIQINFIDDIDYPLLPLTNELKQYILELDKKGMLP